MKGDFSRSTFDPARHYAGVRMQQGRVQVDADWNEQVDLARHRMETGTLDAVGHCGGPLHDAGFRVVRLADAAPGVRGSLEEAYPDVDLDAADDLVVLPGRYYVDGVLCVCEAPVLLSRQPDLPAAPEAEDGPSYPLPPGHHLLYLDVWDRHLTALEEPSLRERALGGPDTATRTRVVWQVRAFGFDPAGEGTGMECVVPGGFEDAVAAPDGRMRARARPAGPDEGPCVVPAGAGYRGLENQLYRVEVHDGGTRDDPAGAAFVEVTAADAAAHVVTVGAGALDGAPWDVGDPVLLYPGAAGGALAPTLAHVAAVAGADLTLTAPFSLDVAVDQPRLRRVGATFKWSRDNGIAVTRVTSVTPDPTSGRHVRVGVESTGPDEVLGFRQGDWVELTDDRAELNGRPGYLAVVDRVEHGARLVVLRTPAGPFDGPAVAANAAHAPRLRRWDGVGILGVGAEDDGFHELEDGVQVRFTQGGYRSGDYWQVPARTATADAQGGNVEWPGNAALPPRGIRHHHCRLAVVHVADADGEPTYAEVSDCRCLFPPASEVRALAYVSGAGQEAMPDYSVADHRPELGLPLVVGVGNGHCRADARVRFRVELGGGDVAEVGAGGWAGEVDVPVDADGTARCRWRLRGDAGVADGSRQHQLVSATLLEDVGAEGAPEWMEVPGRVLFNASLSVARRVAYVPPQCPPMAGRDTVQSALDRLVGLVRLWPAGGDGQEGAPGSALPCPLRVLVADTCGPVASPNRPLVRFRVRSGGGSLSGGAPSGSGVEVPTDQSGVAQVSWTLGSGGCQEVEAELLPAAGPASEPRRAVFTASLAAARRRGCCVTVGMGEGDFDRLEDALKAAEEQGSVCICLLPGVHEVEAPLDVVLPDAAIRVSASGPGPTLLRLRRDAHLRFRGLASFILRDVDVRVEGADQPLRFDDCGQVVLEGCRVGQVALDTPLLTVAGADVVRVTGCTLWSMVPVELGSNGPVTDPLRDRDGTLRRAVDTPLALFEAVAGRVGRRAAAELLQDLPAAAAADALWLVDGNAAATLSDNRVVGYVRLYGERDKPGPVLPPPEAEKDVGGAVANGALRVGSEGGDLHLRGNALLAVTTDAALRVNDAPPDGGEARLERTFRLCALSDNHFAGHASVVVAHTLRLTSNHFPEGTQDDRQELALLGVADSAAAVGNYAWERDVPAIRIYTRRHHPAEAGNWPPVQIV